MSYLLDSSICIALLRDRSSSIKEAFREAIARRDPIWISSVVLHELWYGVHKSSRPVENAEALRGFLRRSGSPLALRWRGCTSGRRNQSGTGADRQNDWLVRHSDRGSVFAQRSYCRNVQPFRISTSQGSALQGLVKIAGCFSLPIRPAESLASQARREHHPTLWDSTDSVQHRASSSRSLEPASRQLSARHGPVRSRDGLHPIRFLRQRLPSAAQTQTPISALCLLR